MSVLLKGLSATCSALVVLLGSASPRGWAASTVDDLTGPWLLFVDDSPIASKTNVIRTYHPFEKYADNPVMVADRPWESTLVYLYGTVLPDESGTSYRMWYHTLRPNDTNNDGSLELYATSPDGIHWTKPNLGLRSWHGSTSNNMYFTRPTAGGITSVMQTSWEPDPAHRYKFMNLDSPGYWAAWSPDGIHVTDAPNNPAFTGGSDVGQFCWDPHTQRYLGYVKNNSYVNGLRRRSVALTTTTNIASWPAESLILEPDTFDDRWVPAGTVQRTHLYGMSAFPYESGYIGFLWIFRATDVDGYYVGPCFVELVSSQDGVQWTRQEGDRPPILPLGPDGAWDDGMVFTARAPVVEGDTIKIWYGGFDQVHGIALSKTTGAIGLATLRKDGFASLDAGATAGSIVTKSLSGVGGPLHVNYRASGGSLRVEVLDQNHNVLPGYSQADCAPLSGDGVNQVVTWATHAELPAGQPFLRLRFLLQNASVYSFMAGASVRVAEASHITLQPEDRIVLFGATATFSVQAGGTAPLGYRWQKHQVNLADDGHYSGCRTATLTVRGVSGSDMASYRCVVTNAYGSATSSPALLTLAPACLPVSLLNGSFEGPSSGGLGTNWIGYQRPPYPTTVWSIQTASPPPGSGSRYQQIANTSSSGGGGVRQDVTGCVIGATYTVSGWMRGNSISYSTCTVKCSPSASTNWATAIDLNPLQSYTGNTWVPFSGTVVATGTNMTIWLDGQTGGSGLNKAECFDLVTVSCTATNPSLYFASAAWLGQNQVRLALQGPPGGTVRIDQSSDLAAWLPLTNLANPDGTVQFIDTTPTNGLPRFYRAVLP